MKPLHEESDFIPDKESLPTLLTLSQITFTIEKTIIN